MSQDKIVPRLAGSRVTLIGTATNAVKGTLYVGRSPHEGFFTPSGKELWIAVRGEDYVSVIDPVKMKEVRGLTQGAYSPGRAVLAGLVGALANSAAIRLSRALGVEAGTSGLSKWLAVHLNDWFHLGLSVHLRPPAQEAFHTAVGILAGLRHTAPWLEPDILKEQLSRHCATWDRRTLTPQL